MSRGDGQSDLLRLWFEAQAELLDRAGRDAAWERAEELFRSWSRLLDSLGPTAAATATPFDPSGWLKPAGEAGMAVLGGWLSGAGLGGLGLGDIAAGSATGRPAVEWQAYLAALERHRAITGAAWLAAFREFSEQSRRAERNARRHGTERPDWQKLFDLWQDISDREFAAMQRSEEFLTAQATLMRAGLDARARARAQVETLAEALGLPTRAEIDDLTEQVDALRREIRQIKGPK